jgi:hypothetical protein
MEYNIFIPQNKQWPTTMFSGEIIIRYDTLSRPLKQTNPLEFRLVVRGFARGDVPREDSVSGLNLREHHDLEQAAIIKYQRDFAKSHRSYIPKGSGRVAAALLSQTVVTDGQWHCVGLVWDGSQRTFCV